mgnify:CR=1 FL=1
MALAIWPAGLPQCLQRSGYSQTLANNITSTNFDVGAPQVRQRSTAAPETITGSILLKTNAELALFRTFYNSTLLSGSQRFEWLDPVSQVLVQMQFDPKTQPSFTNEGGTVYRVNMQLTQYAV